MISYSVHIYHLGSLDTDQLNVFFPPTIHEKVNQSSERIVPLYCCYMYDNDTLK